VTTEGDGVHEKKDECRRRCFHNNYENSGDGIRLFFNESRRLCFATRRSNVKGEENYSSQRMRGVSCWGGGCRGRRGEWQRQSRSDYRRRSNVKGEEDYSSQSTRGVACSGGGCRGKGACSEDLPPLSCRTGRGGFPPLLVRVFRVFSSSMGKGWCWWRRKKKSKDVWQFELRVVRSKQFEFFNYNVIGLITFVSMLYWFIIILPCRQLKWLIKSQWELYRWLSFSRYLLKCLNNFFLVGVGFCFEMYTKMECQNVVPVVGTKCSQWMGSDHAILKCRVHGWRKMFPPNVWIWVATVIVDATSWSV
jgi:hypothetical protein